MHESWLLDHDYALREITANAEEIQAALRSLAVAQENTERKLRAFIDSLRQGGNGRK